MFHKHGTDGYKDALPGIKQKTVVFGDKTLMTEFLLQANNVLPEHSHPFEQTGYLVSGHIILKVGDESFDVRAGDSWCIPTNITHGARIVEDSTAVEVFSPVRQDYLPQKG